MLTTLAYNVYFDIAALMLTATLLLLNYLHRSYPSLTGLAYKFMLWINLASTASDIVSSIAITYPEKFSATLCYLFNALYLILHNLTAVVFLLYVLALIRGNYGKKAEKIIIGAVTLFVTFAVSTTQLTHLVFYFDDNMEYQHGPLIYTIYISAVLIFVYAMYLFIRYHKKLNNYQTATNMIFLTFVMAAVGVQALNPELLIESFSISIAMLMMNVSLDNPAVYLYRNTYCFNRLAFGTEINSRLEKKSKFTLFAFTFDDLAVLKKKFDESVYDSLIKNTISVCHDMFGQRRVFIIGDDVFVILLSDEGSVINLADKLSEKAGKNVRISDDKTINLVPHFCVLSDMSMVEDSNDAEDALTNMLFDVYRKTGDRLIYNNPRLLEAKHRESNVIHQLHRAIQNDGFEICYQPIYDRTSGSYFSLEALARLKNHPDIGPDEFIKAAENNGMMLEIGEIVYEKVCAFWKENDLASLGVTYIDVNLSMLQLLSKNSASRLHTITKKYGVDPRSVIFEITETATAGEKEKLGIMETIQYLSSRGYTFSLDDYGSGYATAAYLAEMPFSIVKIDKGILWNAMKDDSYKTVLRNSVSLVKEFGRECVVEGVETAEMADMLSEMGCDYFQGYLYSRPLRPEDAIDFLKRHLN